MQRRDFIKYGVCAAGMGVTFVLCNSAADRNIFSETNEKIFSNNNICRLPFEHLEIGFGGDVYPCCLGMTETILGNIKNQTIDEIWEGEAYKKFRERIISGDYSLCKREFCFFEPLEDERIINNDKYELKEIKLSYDNECNYRCKTCRDEIILNDENTINELDNDFLPKLLSYAPKINKLSVSGLGDPLFSKHSRKLISLLCQKNKNIKLELCTNGYFCNEKTVKELGITDNIHSVFVSVDAATAETYKKIIRVDAFDRIVENLKYLSRLKKQGKISLFLINFVIHSLNYKEMPDFVKMAKKLDAIAYFTVYQKWGSVEMDKHYDEYAIFEPTHKDYQKFKNLLKNPVFKSKHCRFHGRLLQLALKQ